MQGVLSSLGDDLERVPFPVRGIRQGDALLVLPSHDLAFHEAHRTPPLSIAEVCKSDVAPFLLDDFHVVGVQLNSHSAIERVET